MRNVGALVLARGSSLVGRVETANGAPVSRLCRVELLASAVALLRAEDPRRADARSTRAGAQGFFQLAGVAPGSYALSVSQPGFATTTLMRVVIERDQETQLAQPLVLTLPLQLEVEVSPALDPWGQPWRAVLMRKELAFGKVREAAGGPVISSSMGSPRGPTSRGPSPNATITSSARTLSPSRDPRSRRALASAWCCTRRNG